MKEGGGSASLWAMERLSEKSDSVPYSLSLCAVNRVIRGRLSKSLLSLW